jgi:hypothetical protein
MQVISRPPRHSTVLLLGLLGLLALAGIGFMAYSTNQGVQAVEEWVQTYPTNAMVLQKHPNTLPRFIQHFQSYYDRSGKDGLLEGQLEMQQIMNVNYLTDYIWEVKDPQLRQFLTAAYNMIQALVNKGNGQPGLCEKYFGNSAHYAEVNQTLGGDLFPDYMKASEKLLLSAKAQEQYPIHPKSMGYFRFVEAVNARFWKSYRGVYPGLTYDEMQARAQSFDPLRSCVGYASYLRVLLTLDDTSMSLLWRSAMETDRPRWEAMRQQRGSE